MTNMLGLEKEEFKTLTKLLNKVANTQLKLLFETILEGVEKNG